MKIRALVVLCVGTLGLITAGCDDGSPARLLNVATSTFTPDGRFSPNPIALTRFTNAGCRDGLTFASPFHLIVSAGVHDLTLDHATIHMIDGTNLGGPSITIPQSEFAAQTSSLFIHAGSTRDFLVHPNFGCFTTRPRSLVGNVFLVDRFGVMQRMAFEGAVQ